MYRIEEAYLISVVLLRRHLSDDQRAVLALKYAEILSKARKTERAEKARAIQLNKENGLVDTVSSKPDTQNIRTRKEVAEKFKIPERKLKYIKEIQELTYYQLQATGGSRFIEEHVNLF